MATEPRIGTRIKRARERKSMSQAELAAAVGVSRSAVNAWENNRTSPQSSAARIEDILGITIEVMTEEEKISAMEAEAAELLQAARKMRAARERRARGGQKKDEDDEPERVIRRHAV